MPIFTVIATSVAQGDEQAELDVVVDEFASADEAIGYTRRMAEETHKLAAQLTLDFDYSHVAVYEGEVEAEHADVGAPELVGMWLFAADGVEWADASDLRGDEAEGVEAEPAQS